MNKSNKITVIIDEREKERKREREREGERKRERVCACVVYVLHDTQIVLIFFLSKLIKKQLTNHQKGVKGVDTFACERREGYSPLHIDIQHFTMSKHVRLYR